MPLVLVQTTVLGLPREFTALVDSGADATMIPAGLLAAYGIDLTTLVQNGWSVGANGTKIPKYDFLMELWHRNRRFATQVSVLPSLPVPVLGRDDFMRAFGIHFHWDIDPPEWCVRRISNPRP